MLLFFRIDTKNDDVKATFMDLSPGINTTYLFKDLFKTTDRKSVGKAAIAYVFLKARVSSLLRKCLSSCFNSQSIVDVPDR